MAASTSEPTAVDSFPGFMQAQIETIQRYVAERLSRGDTRDEETLAMLWIDQHAATFRSAWSG
jgi:hypothetical protein